MRICDICGFQSCEDNNFVKARKDILPEKNHVDICVNCMDKIENKVNNKMNELNLPKLKIEWAKEAIAEILTGGR